MNPAEESNQPDGHRISYRCRLCRFPIRLGETVVADVGESKLTPGFPFGRNAHFERDLHMVLQGYHLKCSHEEEGEQLPAYHVECLRYAPPLTKEGLRATKYTYEPTTSEDPRRASRIRDVAGRRLQMECPILPAEVCLLITEELVRECAATTIHELLQGRNLQALDSELNISLGVWARYTSIDGIHYVESLSNTGDSQSVLLLGADRASAPELLYVLEDHLGIRQVVGLKLRSISSKSTRNSPESTTVAWPTPMAPFQEPMFTIWAKILINKPIMDMSRTHLRTVSLDFNDPAITGYSVCWISGVMGVHAHYGVEKFTAYDSFDQCYETPTWIYIPIAPGERITGIWTRSGGDSFDAGVMFQTNQGRLATVGHCEDSQGERLDEAKHWGELSSVSKKRFRVHYQLSYRGVEKLVAQPLSGLEQSFSGKIMPPLPSLNYAAWPRCHYSTVSLENVVEIIPCRRKVKPLNTPYWAITGVLLRYANGGRACAGEFRMDCAGEPINVDGALFVYLGSVDKTKITYWHLSRIDLNLIEDDECQGWWYLAMEGTLQWWFGDEGRCRISWIDDMGQIHSAT
ncbi:hypothetical protein NCS56_01232900 [Fusarium sp. Ph1]|nr:hypothetical protein NCS56_01232900 [Fusarium sp. Ph1]